MIFRHRRPQTGGVAMTFWPVHWGSCETNGSSLGMYTYAVQNERDRKASVKYLDGPRPQSKRTRRALITRPREDVVHAVETSQLLDGPKTLGRAPKRGEVVRT